jgi:hypothetical protein
MFIKGNLMDKESQKPSSLLPLHPHVCFSSATNSITNLSLPNFTCISTNGVSRVHRILSPLVLRIFLEPSHFFLFKLIPTEALLKKKEVLQV